MSKMALWYFVNFVWSKKFEQILDFASKPLEVQAHYFKRLIKRFVTYNTLAPNPSLIFNQEKHKNKYDHLYTISFKKECSHSFREIAQRRYHTLRRKGLQWTPKRKKMLSQTEMLVTLSHETLYIYELSIVRHYRLSPIHVCSYVLLNSIRENSDKINISARKHCYSWEEFFFSCSFVKRFN